MKCDRLMVMAHQLTIRSLPHSFYILFHRLMDKPKRYERFIQSSNLCGTTIFLEVRRRWRVGSDCKSDALRLRGFESLHFHENIFGRLVPIGRTSDLHSEGYRFKPDTVHKYNIAIQFNGKTTDSYPVKNSSILLIATKNKGLWRSWFSASR